jgi:DNA invertase Pin-like site-specific DNA recombinase
VTGARLVIAKLDRLSRNAAFLLTLKDSGVKFIAADMPEANDLTVGIMALVAQQEREAISKRTREALAAAKARGQRLGNPNGAAALRRASKGNKASLASIKEKADKHATRLGPVVASLRAEGCETLEAIAEQFNQRGILAPRGGRWYKSSVRNLLARLVRLGLLADKPLDAGVNFPQNGYNNQGSNYLTLGHQKIKITTVFLMCGIGGGYVSFLPDFSIRG